MITIAMEQHLKGSGIKGKRGDEGVAVVTVEVDSSVRLQSIDCSGGGGNVGVRHIDRLESDAGGLQQLLAPRRLRVL